MDRSSYMQAQNYKSRSPVVAGFLLRSRETQKRRCEQLQEQTQRLGRDCRQQETARELAHERALALQARVRQLLAEIKTLESQPLRLPDDPPIATHGYGARMISLCVNLAQKIGLRATSTILRIVFEWLGMDLDQVQQQLPDWTTIRTWMQRVGVAAIQAPVEEADDWIWMADHSNQIGPEKALVVLGVRASNMPDPGTPLKHEDVCLLSVEPGTTWKREDMAAAYEGLARRIGDPLAVLIDGAVELRDGAEVLKKRRSDTVVLGDFKHRAANVIKALVGNDERFAEFSTLVGRTRCAIQQTELAHLTPPGPKPKSRFMNLAATLRWAAMVLWLLDQPDAKARSGISDERLEEKLGWLREFTGEVAAWNECQSVVSASLTFINEQGLFRGAAEELRPCIEQDLKYATSREVAQRLIAFVQESEDQLQEGDRLPMSTEILESSFGLYKQLERQHSKGGFTSLLAAFGSLLKPTTPASIRHDFTLVSVKQMRQWVADKIGSTQTAKRQTAYQEFANARHLLQPHSQ